MLFKEKRLVIIKSNLVWRVSDHVDTLICFGVDVLVLLNLKESFQVNILLFYYLLVHFWEKLGGTHVVLRAVRKPQTYQKQLKRAVAVYSLVLSFHFRHRNWGILENSPDFLQLHIVHLDFLLKQFKYFLDALGQDLKTQMLFFFIWIICESLG